MADEVVTLSQDQISRLADKLDGFGESLDADERRALIALLSVAAEQRGSDEVTGFALTHGGMLNIAVADGLRFALLGDALRLNVDLQIGKARHKTGSG